MNRPVIVFVLVLLLSAFVVIFFLTWLIIKNFINSNELILLQFRVISVEIVEYKENEKDALMQRKCKQIIELGRPRYPILQANYTPSFEHYFGSVRLVKVLVANENCHPVFDFERDRAFDILAIIKKSRPDYLLVSYARIAVTAEEEPKHVVIGRIFNDEYEIEKKIGRKEACVDKLLFKTCKIAQIDDSGKEFCTTKLYELQNICEPMLHIGDIYSLYREGNLLTVPHRTRVRAGGSD